MSMQALSPADGLAVPKRPQNFAKAGADRAPPRQPVACAGSGDLRQCRTGGGPFVVLAVNRSAT
jgi:hypothetical protein